MLRRERSIVIAIDVDEVLAGVHGVMIAEYNRAKGTNYTINDHADWDFKSIGSNYAEMMGFYVDAWQNHNQEIRLLADPEKIRELGQYFVIDAPSSRGRDGVTDGACDGLMEWWERNKLEWFPFFCDSTKIDKLRLEYPVYIDDSPKLAEKIVSRNDNFLLLVDKPYNRHIEECSNILRTADFNSAADEIIDASIKIGHGKVHYQSPEGQAFIQGKKNWREYRQRPLR